MMPWAWLSGSPPTTTASSPTSGSATSTASTASTVFICDAANTAPVWVQAHQAQMLAASAAATAQAYQAITQPHWHGLGNQTAAANVYSTATTSASTTVWVDAQGMSYVRTAWVDAGTNTVIWEDRVDQAQYMALAQGRVVRTEDLQREYQQRQEERAREIAEHERQMAARTARYREVEAQSVLERNAALQRSRELLLSHLTPKQRKTFEENQWFLVQGGVTKTRYRIRTLTHTHNIDIMHGQKVTSRLCGHLRGALPLHDHHVAQKISLEYDEETFVRLCNRSAA